MALLDPISEGQLNERLMNATGSDEPITRTRSVKKIQSNRDLRLSTIAGLSLRSLEGPQSVIEAVAVLTAIIIVHESDHFLATYLQGIHVSKFVMSFVHVLAKFNSKNMNFSIMAFPLGDFVGFSDNDPESNSLVGDDNLLKNRPIIDRVLVILELVEGLHSGDIIPQCKW
ncbi:hypothetical protein AMTR_s00060p00157630 [Amborella trichopoda]|uniref:Peptidase M50 domain-containing protein n=1 Tax=Amborella trichopoda TaxID=13333 RepID=W1NJE2_AMBTC|nr:hypothetical protein AMTR_s00060p00157630 [Amborella trichopoda]